MERTGGEPDVVSYDEERDGCVFFDCSPESPAGRRGLCYDYEAWESRKAFKPDDNAVDMALAMGIEMLTEAQYRELQKLGEFDTRTSSWIATPSDIRRLGGALFCDRRYNHVFTYHKGRVLLRFQRIPGISSIQVWCKSQKPGVVVLTERPAGGHLPWCNLPERGDWLHHPENSESAQAGTLDARSRCIASAGMLRQRLRTTNTLPDLSLCSRHQSP